MKKLLALIICSILTATTFAIDANNNPVIISKDGIKALDKQTAQGIFTSLPDPTIILTPNKIPNGSDTSSIWPECRTPKPIYDIRY